MRKLKDRYNICHHIHCIHISTVCARLRNGNIPPPHTIHCVASSMFVSSRNGLLLLLLLLLLVLVLVLLLLLYYYYYCTTTTVLLLQYYYYSTTTTVLLQQYYYNSTTTTVLLQQYYHNSTTTTVLRTKQYYVLPQCYISQITISRLPGPQLTDTSHKSKFEGCPSHNSQANASPWKHQGNVFKNTFLSFLWNLR